jgi:suppressor of ftsI
MLASQSGNAWTRQSIDARVCEMTRGPDQGGSTERLRSRRMGRRHLLAGTAGSLGTAALAVGFLRSQSGVALAAQDAPLAMGEFPPGPAPGTTAFVEPPVRASANGLLETDLTAAPDPADELERMTYDGLFPGPTLRVKPGDALKIHLHNGLGGHMTNLHLHGMHVSPRANSDNIFIAVEPGATFSYGYRIPSHHVSGLNWYHPHHHGDVTTQVAAGLSGALIVEGEIDQLPALRDLRERLLILQGPYLSPDAPPYLINGRPNPGIDIQPGETQRWRFLNATSNTFANLALDAHQLHLSGLDGIPLPAVRSVGSTLVGPGERVEFLVQGGPSGQYVLRSLAWGPAPQRQDEFGLATLVSAGASAAPAPLPAELGPVADLSQVDVAAQRIVTFQENPTSPVFTIDHRVFNPDAVDFWVKLGAVEEWVIRNTSAEWHPFHIHVNDFQVLAINGVPVDPFWNDTISLPPRGSVTMRIRFADFTGRTVFHCHILSHEDFGMMSVVSIEE